MKRTKKLKVYILLLLIVGIITLIITGSANINVYSWDIKIKKTFRKSKFNI